jgi:hypothetical protein
MHLSLIIILKFNKDPDANEAYYRSLVGDEIPCTSSSGILYYIILYIIKILVRNPNYEEDQSVGNDIPCTSTSGLCHYNAIKYSLIFYCFFQSPTRCNNQLANTE